MGGGGACVGSGMVGKKDYCKIPGIIWELWEDLPYSFQFFFELLLNEGWSRGSRCIVGEATEVHVADIVVGVDFGGVDFGIFCSNFCGCGRFLKE